MKIVKFLGIPLLVAVIIFLVLILSCSNKVHSITRKTKQPFELTLIREPMWNGPRIYTFKYENKTYIVATYNEGVAIIEHSWP